MTLIIEKKEIKPKCPHCERYIDKLIEVKRGAFKIN
jgi:hypothetical protein